MSAVAKKFYEMADKLDKEIEAKLHPATAKQNPTRRRAGIIESMRQDGIKLQKIQARLMGLAKMHENGTICEPLSLLTTRKIVEHILFYDSYPSLDNAWSRETRGMLARYGIKDAEVYGQAHRDLVGLGETGVAQPTAADKIRAMERELIGARIEGYFPTPPNVVDEMLKHANIEADDWVLEPSAGKGNIADAVRPLILDGVLHVIEVNWTLKEILEAKGYELVANDFLAYQEPSYDVIIMNPPFENLQDIDHVRHAYDLLAEGGRLVSIMSESPFFRQDKKAVAFRAWLESLDGYYRELGQAFKQSERSTGVTVRLVVIYKPYATSFSSKNGAPHSDLSDIQVVPTPTPLAEIITAPLAEISTLPYKPERHQLSMLANADDEYRVEHKRVPVTPKQISLFGDDE